MTSDKARVFELLDGLIDGWRALILAALVGCASPQPTPEAPGDSPAPPLMIYRESSYPDAELAAAGLGRLEIAVRSADRPAQSLPGALAILQLPATAQPRRAPADSLGVIRVDSLPIGTHVVQVVRIGYWRVTVPGPVTAGCRTDVEVYLGVVAMGINPPPPTTRRPTITTCRPAT